MDDDDRVDEQEQEEQEEAISVASSQVGVRSSLARRPEKPAPASPIVIMEDIIDKLKLLDYEDVFPPLSRTYFATLYKPNPGEQFRTLVEYISWILQDLLKVPGYEPPDQYSDPNATASSLVTELKKVGINVDSPAKLKQGYGDTICFTLDQLLDLALQKQSFRIKAPIIPPNIIFSEDDIYDEEDSDEEEDPNKEESEEEEDVYVAGSSRVTGVRASGTGINGNRDVEDGKPTNKAIESDVNAQEWRLELEHVAPQLVLRLNVDHKDWRTHVESMSEQEKIIQELLPETSEKLARIAEEVSKLTDRISKREKMLSDDSTISSMLNTFKKNQEELEQITIKYKEYEESISSLTNELSAVSTDLEQVNTEVDHLRKMMGDTTPLNQIKEALQKLKAEIRNMDMRTGVLTDSLMQAKVKTNRSQSASTQRQIKRAQSAGIVPENYGFDPFAINNGNTSFMLDDEYD